MRIIERLRTQVAVQSQISSVQAGASLHGGMMGPASASGPSRLEGATMCEPGVELDCKECACGGGGERERRGDADAERGRGGWSGAPLSVFDDGGNACFTPCPPTALTWEWTSAPTLAPPHSQHQQACQTAVAYHRHPKTPPRTLAPSRATACRLVGRVRLLNAAGGGIRPYILREAHHADFVDEVATADELLVPAQVPTVPLRETRHRAPCHPLQDPSSSYSSSFVEAGTATVGACSAFTGRGVAAAACCVCWVFRLLGLVDDAEVPEHEVTNKDLLIQHVAGIRKLDV
ncbi:hypothetical protein EI94DRAFT_1791855 [Lactarius quietus]|nr:hypothetical protein EI94DRAFT_1791855 [Lactarius quietus]